MFCLESFLPLRAGSFCSSRFLARLNRDELCRRSFFTIWGPPEYLILLSWVGGGVLLLGRLLAVCWAWREKTPQMFRIKMGTLCRSMPWHHFWSQKDRLQCLPDDKHNRRDKIQRQQRKKAILLIRCRFCILQILILEGILLEKCLDTRISARWVINVFDEKRKSIHFKCVYLLKSNFRTGLVCNKKRTSIWKPNESRKMVIIK